MSEELKPCPFCGGEAYIHYDYSSEHDATFWQVWHTCPQIGAHRHTYGHGLGMDISTPWNVREEDAVAAWNRRAERTCRNAFRGREFECSECGTTWHLLSRGDALAEWGHVRDPNYCPNCGAKVVDE